MSPKTFNIISNRRTQLIDITRQVQEVVGSTGLKEGVCTVFVPHTTAGITINENADPSVREDIEEALERLVPWEGQNAGLRSGYRHSEGNSAAHIKAALVGSSVQIPVSGGRLAFGSWQGIYFCEFDGPRGRNFQVVVTPA